MVIPCRNIVLHAALCHYKFNMEVMGRHESIKKNLKMKNYRWTTLGCGVIANQLAQALQKEGRTLYSVANRTYQKAVDFAEKYGVTKVYENIQEAF